MSGATGTLDLCPASGSLEVATGLEELGHCVSAVIAGHRDDHRRRSAVLSSVAHPTAIR